MIVFQWVCVCVSEKNDKSIRGRFLVLPIRSSSNRFLNYSCSQLFRNRLFVLFSLSPRFYHLPTALMILFFNVCAINEFITSAQINYCQRKLHVLSGLWPFNHRKKAKFAVRSRNFLLFCPMDLTAASEMIVLLLSPCDVICTYREFSFMSFKFANYHTIVILASLSLAHVSQQFT